jgi:hypothetical protein
MESTSFKQCDLINSQDVRKTIYDVLRSTVTHDAAERGWAKLTPYLWQEHFLKQSQNLRKTL